MTWDRHTTDEGLSVQLCRVDDSNRLLLSLNEIGTEMEVFAHQNDPQSTSKATAIGRP